MCHRGAQPHPKSILRTEVLPMAGTQPYPITVTLAQQAVLDRFLRQYTCLQALARRSKIILAAARQPNKSVSRTLGCSPTTVRL